MIINLGFIKTVEKIVEKHVEKINYVEKITEKPVQNAQGKVEKKNKFLDNELSQISWAGASELFLVAEHEYTIIGSDSSARTPNSSFPNNPLLFPHVPP